MQEHEKSVSLKSLGSIDDVKVPDVIDGVPLQDCPFCGHKVEKPLATEYGFSIIQNLYQVANAERDRAREFSYIARNLELMRDRLFGLHIGKIQENLTIEHLKSACPDDIFSEEFADKHGTDIVATVRHKGSVSGKISVSVKHRAQWSSNFVNQLARNIDNDKSDAGILVTTSFPREALNKNIWLLLCGGSAACLLVKPEFAATAYFAARTISINKHLGINLTPTNRSDYQMEKDRQ